MKAIDLAIAVLKASTAVVAITTHSRIYPVTAPQGMTLPHVVVNLIAGDDEQLLGGAGHLFTSRIQVDCIATSVALAAQLGEAVNAALEQRPANPPSDLDDCFTDGIAHSDSSEDGSIIRVLRGYYLIHR